MVQEATLSQKGREVSRVVGFPGRIEPLPGTAAGIGVRTATAEDLSAIVALDAAATGRSKPDYWNRVFRRFAEDQRRSSYFIVATQGDRTVGFLVGELRQWEFGTPPGGWVIAINVASQFREHGIGSLLIAEVCRRFKTDGAQIVRTLLQRNDSLNFAFFRGNGFTAGPFVELECRL